MSNPTSTSTPTSSNSVADASESSDDDTIEYEIEVVTSSPSSSSSSSASSTSDHSEADKLADNIEEANAQANTGEVNNDIKISGAALIINPTDERDAESNYEVHNEHDVKQQDSSSLDEPVATVAATTTAISETSNVDQSAIDQRSSTDTELSIEFNTSHVAPRQPGKIEANSMGGSQVAQQQAIGGGNSKDADESSSVYESNQVGAKTTEPQEEVSYCAGCGGGAKSRANNEDINYPQLISSDTDNDLNQQPADSSNTFKENRGLVIETEPSTSESTSQPMQIMPSNATSELEILSTNQIDNRSNKIESSLIDEGSRIPSECNGSAAFINKDDESGARKDNASTNDLIKLTTQQVGSNSDFTQPIENGQYHEQVKKSEAASELQMHRQQSAKLMESSDNIVESRYEDVDDQSADLPDADQYRPSDNDTKGKEQAPITTSSGPISVGISVEPPPQQATNTNTGLTLSISPDTVFRRESFSEDLEREFDEEPEFEPRIVTLKRDQDVRLLYELADELGRGRFGTVCRCRETATGRSLAAKFINVRRPEDREDVEREIGIMSQLQHKRLLQLYDAFDNRAQNEMCLITELIEGGELFERIVDDDFDLTEKKAAVFMRQICEGVEYMHSQQIVHLDMKPENILCLSKTGNRIKLIDFGLARQLDANRPLHVMFGTPDFAAPEVLSYETVTFATDMWSIGVICYVLLSGLLPFMGDNDMQTMANVTKAEFEFDEQAFEPISDLAKDFISKLLIKDPNKRLKPRECLQHAWLQRGGVQLEAAVIERRKSSIASLSFLLSGAQQARLEQLALLASSPKSGTGSTDSSRTPTGPRGSISIPIQQQVDPVNWSEQLSTCSTADAIIPALFSLSKRNLKRYVIRRKWHKTVHAIMALGRMGATLRSKLVP